LKGLWGKRHLRFVLELGHRRFKNIDPERKEAGESLGKWLMEGMKRRTKEDRGGEWEVARAKTRSVSGGGGSSTSGEKNRK